MASSAPIADTFSFVSRHDAESSGICMSCRTRRARHPTIVPYTVCHASLAKLGIDIMATMDIYITLLYWTDTRDHGFGTEYENAERMGLSIMC